MKVGFVADIHIKLGQKNVPTTWARNRFDMLWTQLKSHEHKVDKWVIGGDVFDRVPSVEEMEIFFDMVSMFGKPTIIYSGNHEAIKKDTTFLSYLKNTVVKLNPLVQIIDTFYTDEAGIDYIPYNKLKEYHPADIDFHGRVLCTHVRGEIPPHVKPEFPLELFDRWDVVLAGDLHSYENSQRNILYPGSPATTSYHRSRVSTGFIVLDTVDLTHTWEQLDLPQLIKKTIRAGDPTPGTDFDHTMYEVEGDMSELAVLDDNVLVDKKITKRSTETALILSPTMNLVEEVSEYLTYILMLEDSTIKSILQELNDNAAELIEQ